MIEILIEKIVLDSINGKQNLPEEHCLKAPELLREGGVGEDVIHEEMDAEA